eukprot:gene9081-8893_t
MVSPTPLPHPFALDGEARAALNAIIPKEVQDLFGLLALAPARRLLAGVSASWEQAEPAEVADFLQSWRSHRLAMLQTAYLALHDLVLGSWYADPSSWAAIGYPGPRKDGWQVTDASRLNADLTLETDVVIVGSGAGGGVTAEILALSGLRVLIVEEGALHSSNDFNMNEAQAYPQLYQESAARKTRDKAINILQGRT